MTTRLITVGGTDYVRTNIYGYINSPVFPGTLYDIGAKNTGFAQNLFNMSNVLANVLRKMELHLPTHMQQINVNEENNTYAERFNATSYAEVSSYTYSKGVLANFTMWERFYRFQPVDYPDIEIYLKISCQVMDLDSSQYISRCAPKIVIEAGLSLDAETSSLGGVFLSRMLANVYHTTPLSSNISSGSISGFFSIIIKDNSITFSPPVAPIMQTITNMRNTFYKNVASSTTTVITYENAYNNPIHVGVAEYNTGPLTLNIPVAVCGDISAATMPNTSTFLLGAAGLHSRHFLTSPDVGQHGFNIPKVPKIPGISPILVNGRPVMMPVHMILADSSVVTANDIFFLYDYDPLNYSVGIKTLTIGDESLKGYHFNNSLGLSDTGGQGERGSVSLFTTMDSDYETYSYTSS